ncbi:phosphoglycerate mutase [Geothrix oryzae]|uniref:Phosphoglycerate mutase n=1 Tax=Geothrix oryzae TaxID=2927975 RepID=A0ABM8DS31_9BACT|nr:phosphoglycerate mutase family protein [Geothrix oryzae]BDU69814.1 phosphoglycerate mutase [Geothrix oryzae]
MPVLRYRRGILLACLLALAVNLGAQDLTVVLLRHAERQSLFDADSPLAEAGLRRAQALVPLLEGFRPAVLFTSDLRRTQQTLAPLAAKLGMVPLVRSKDGSEALAAELLRDHRGRTVIVCWHHDLVKKVARGLGVKGPLPYWTLDTYDRLWIVRVPAQGAVSLEERIQEPSAPAAAGAAQGR